MYKFKYIKKVTKEQISFCNNLNFSVKGNTVSLAFAKIEDLVEMGFYNNSDLGRPSKKQIDLAAQFGYDISKYTKREGDAIIDDLMTELNLDSINKQKLTIGIKVINKWDNIKRIEIISSIKEDGTVYLKGGNGKRAWGRNLIRVD